MIQIDGGQQPFQLFPVQAAGGLDLRCRRGGQGGKATESHKQGLGLAQWRGGFRVGAGRQGEGQQLQVRGG